MESCRCKIAGLGQALPGRGTARSLQPRLCRQRAAGGRVRWESLWHDRRYKEKLNCINLSNLRFRKPHPPGHFSRRQISMCKLLRQQCNLKLLLFFPHIPKLIFSLGLPCVSCLLSALQSTWFKFNKGKWTILKIASRRKIHVSFPLGKGRWGPQALTLCPCFGSWIFTLFLHTWSWWWDLNHVRAVCKLGISWLKIQALLIF